MNNKLDYGFSVLISVYERDKPDFLMLALDSIFEQTLKPNEIILVKDGFLTIPLENVIEHYKKRETIAIIEVNLVQNVGLGKALNIGLGSCHYNLVARMDSDDICILTRFEEQIAFLKRNEDVSVVGGQVEEFNFIPGDLQRYRNLPYESSAIIQFSKYRNPINHPTVIFRKDHVAIAGSYQDMPLFEDYYLWTRMMNMGYKVTNINKVLLNFRVGNDMIGRRHGVSYLKKEFRFLKAIRKLGFIDNKDLIVSLLTKAPLRLLPKIALKFIYKNFLR